MSKPEVCFLKNLINLPVVAALFFLINIFPVNLSGKTLLCLQDPLNVSQNSLFLPAPVYFIVSHFDGHHSVLDIQAEYMRRFGEILFSEKIQEIIGLLEENLFLEGDTFQEALRQKEEGFQRSSVREAVPPL